jgi:nitrite reductase/ring-hydroxylating ferredoxin subunit
MASQSPSDAPNEDRIWHKALDLDELPEGRVKAVTCGDTTVAMAHYEGKYAALDNKCPHQGGPLGEGSIEERYCDSPPVIALDCFVDSGFLL